MMTRKLLIVVVKDRSPELLKVIELESINADQIEALCDVVVDEFSSTGLREDDEPNPRGLELEGLIDVLR